MPAGDFDSDGIRDVLRIEVTDDPEVVGNAAISRFRMDFAGVSGVTGATLWSVGGIFNGWAYPATVGTGRAGAIIASYGSTTDEILTPTLHLLAIDGSGTMVWKKDLSGILVFGVHVPLLFGFADANGDGTTDALLGIEDSFEGVSELALSFASGVDGSAYGSTSFGPNLGSGFLVLLTGDLSGDRLPDYVVAESASPLLNFPDDPGHIDLVSQNRTSFAAVRGADGAGLWSSPSVAINADAIAAAAAGDVNGDGRIDVVINGYGSESYLPGGPVSALLSGAGGTLWTKDAGPAEPIGDVTGDGRDDIGTQEVVLGSNYIGVRYSVFDDRGNLLDQRLYSVPRSDPYSSTSVLLMPNVGDLDSDGHTDAAHIIQVPDIDSNTMRIDQGAISGLGRAKLWSAKPGQPLFGPVTQPSPDLVLESSTSGSFILTTQEGTTGADLWSSRIDVAGDSPEVDPTEVADVTGDGFGDLFVSIFDQGSRRSIVLSGLDGSVVLAG